MRCNQCGKDLTVIDNKTEKAVETLYCPKCGFSERWGMTKKEGKRMAILRVTPDILREVLNLPEHAVVTQVEGHFEKPGTVDVMVKGIGWEMLEWECVMRANPPEKVYKDCGHFGLLWDLPR